MIVLHVDRQKSFKRVNALASAIFFTCSIANYHTD